MIKKSTQEAYEILELWQPTKKILNPENIISKDNPYFELMKEMYHKTEHLYQSLPKRKNGEHPFIHPINIINFLKKSGIQSPIIICVGLLHDYIEEQVDLYKKESGIEEKEEGIILLDEYEEQCIQKLKTEIQYLTKKYQLNTKETNLIISSIRLLTRHKRDYYYASISGIFDSKDEQSKRIAIQVKLADRTHNILCIEGYNEEARLFQCFKNLFILNNTKKYLQENKRKLKRAKKVIKEDTQEIEHIERLFNKCSKSTYVAFLTLLHLTQSKGIMQIVPMLQLAFKKYALEESGLWAVTEVNKKDPHLTRLYQGIVRKWDARLHHEWEIFENRKKEENTFVTNFFKQETYTSDQIKAIIDYKDAYSLKEVIAHLLYDENYFIAKFTHTDLTKKRRLKQK